MLIRFSPISHHNVIRLSLRGEDRRSPAQQLLRIVLGAAIKASGELDQGHMATPVLHQIAARKEPPFLLIDLSLVSISPLLDRSMMARL